MSRLNPFNWFRSNPKLRERDRLNSAKISNDPVALSVLPKDLPLTNEDLYQQIANLAQNKERIQLLVNQAIYIQEVSNMTENQKRQKRLLEAKIVEIDEKIGILNQELADNFIALSIEDCSRMYQRQSNPQYRLASSLSGKPISEQTETLVSLANELNSARDEKGHPLLKEQIPKIDINDASRLQTENICKKLGKKVGRAIASIVETIWDYKWHAGKATFLMKFGMMPFITAGTCLSVPTSFLVGPATGLFYLTLCLGFSGVMIYKDEGLQETLRDFADGKYVGTLKDITLSSVYNSTVNVLGNGHYRFLTDDLPLLASGTLKMAAAARGLSHFGKNPTNAAEDAVGLLGELDESLREYIDAFVTIEKAVIKLTMRIFGELVKGQVEAAGEAVQEGVKVSLGIAGTIVKTSVGTARAIAKEAKDQVRALASEVIDLDAIDARFEQVKEGLSQLAGQAAYSVGGWVAEKIGYSQDRIAINAQKMTSSNLHQDNEIVYEQETFGGNLDQNSQYLPNSNMELGPSIPGIGYRVSRKNKKSVRKSPRKSVRKNKKSVRKSVRKVAKK